MFSALPMYQRQGKAAFKKDLSNTLAFCKHLNEPQDQFKSIHVGGTNGKGSCSHMLASILQEAGYKVGLYTSPHLKDFRERIKINGLMIEESRVIRFVEENKAFIEELKPSFFEMTVALAFDYFATEKVDIAVIEVGLGGRLDSTNVILPETSLITNIGYDHMDMLGDTLPLIAKEKAGIIKRDVPVVIGEKHHETKEVFINKAKEVNASLFFAEDMEVEIDYELDLKGAYQAKNKQAVVATIAQLKEKGWSISENHIASGLSQVIKNTQLMGRWQILNNIPLTICDTGHNKEAFQYIIDQLERLEFENLWMVLGFVREKNIEELLGMLPRAAHFIFTEANIPRALSLTDLQLKVERMGIKAKYVSDVNDAITLAKQNASDSDVIYIGGSTFVVAEIDDL